jgi:hypothetical protein
LWKKYFRGTRERCLENHCREVKGSPLFSLCKNSMALFTPHLTWVPRSGKKIKIWHDSILGDPPLYLRQDLQRIKNWMDMKNLKILSDISTWRKDRCKTWQGWEVDNLPPELEGDWGALKLCLQGKSPL